MIRKKTLLVILFILFNQLAFASSYYIGDLIKLNITHSNLSKEEVKELFNDFEIVGIDKIKNGYQIAFRSFTPIKKEIKIGNKVIEINISTTLKLYENKDIIDIQQNKKNITIKSDVSAYKVFLHYYFHIIVLLFIVVLIIISIFIFLKIKKSRKNNSEAQKTAYEYFQEILPSVQDDQFFYSITKAFKIYLEKKFQVSILGKTSHELIPEIGKISKSNVELNDWLSYVDQFKYMNNKSSVEEKDKIYKSVINYIQKLEEQQEEK